MRNSKIKKAEEEEFKLFFNYDLTFMIIIRVASKTRLF